MVSIPPVEMATEGSAHFGVAGGVGSIQNELAQGLKVTLDAIQMARRRRCRDQFDVVQRRPLADQRCPVQRQIVVDQMRR
jgi:hypothetical protein